MREWINEAANAAKIARDTNLFAKKELLLKIYGSDLYLKDKKTKGEAKFPYAALAAKSGAASAANQCLTVVPGEGLEPSRPTLRTQDFKSCAYTNSATQAIFIKL